MKFLDGLLGSSRHGRIGVVSPNHTRRWNRADALHRATVEVLESRLLFSATLYWYPVSNEHWNTSDANWNTAWDGSGCQTTWSTGDDAVFVGTGTTVDISTSIDAHSITFSDSGFTVAGGTLTVEQEVFFNAGATISSVITGSGFQANGDGPGVTLTLSGANTYSGDTDVSGGGQVQFTGSALTALPNVDLTLGTYGGGTLTLGGPVTWTGNDVTATNATINITGAVTISGGTWDLNSGSTITVTSLGSLAVTGGSVTTGGLFNYGTVSVSGGSLTTTSADYLSFYNDFAVPATMNWTGGDFSVSGMENDGTLNLGGGTGTFSVTDGGSLENYGTIDWTSGNLAFGGGTLDNLDMLTLEGNDGTLSGATINNGVGTPSTLNWDSGTLSNFSISDDAGDGATASFVGYSLTGMGSSVAGTVPSNGVLDFAGTDTSSLPDVTNDGTIIFDDSVSLVALSGSGTVDEGATYTLDIGSVSGDITGTITNYYVDWGDGAGMDDFTATGDQTHVYAGSETSTTDYTVTVHLATADGVYVNAGTLGVTVDDVAPVVTLDDPAGGGTTGTAPTLTGTAGITPGDADTVTLNIYSGSSVAGSPVVSTDVDVDPDTGEFSYTVDSGSPLAAGTYTFQTVQDEDAGNDATSDPQTFTVALQDPQAVTNLAATAASATEIDLTWDAAPASDFVTNFSVYESTDDGATFTLYDTTSDGSATGMDITGLDPNAPYEFNVVANNANTDDAPSPNNVTPSTWTGTGIAAPTDLTLSLIDDGLGGVHLAWHDNSTNETEYQVEVQWTTGGQFQVIATDLPANTTCYDFTNWPTQPITFRVQVVGPGQSAYTTVDDGSTMGDEGSEVANDGNVTGLSQVGYNSTGAILQWSQDDYNGYGIIYRKKSENSGSYGPWMLGQIEYHSSTPTGEPMTDTIPWDFIGWPEGTQVAIRSYDPTTDDYCVTNVITLSAPAAVAGPPTISSMVVDEVNSQYNLTYNAPSTGVTYTLYNVGAGGGGVFSYIGTISGTSDSVSFGAYGLYEPEFAILATDSSGKASMSNVEDAAFAPSPGLIVGESTNVLSVAALDDGTVGLAWSNNSNNEDGFEVQVSTVGGDNDCDWTTLDTVPADETSYVDTTETGNSTLYYRVRAIRDQTVTESVMRHAEPTSISAPLDSGWVYASAVTTAPISIDAITATMNGQTQKSTDTAPGIFDDEYLSVVSDPGQYLTLGVTSTVALTAPQQAQLCWEAFEYSGDVGGTMCDQPTSTTGATTTLRLNGIGCFNIDVYLDKNSDGSFDTGDTLLRVLNLAMVKVTVFGTVTATPGPGPAATGSGPFTLGTGANYGMQFTAPIHLQGGGPDQTWGTKEIETGWIQNVISDTETIGYGDGTHYGYFAPTGGTALPMLDIVTTQPTPGTGGRTAWADNMDVPAMYYDGYAGLDGEITTRDAPEVDNIPQTRNFGAGFLIASTISGEEDFLDFLASDSVDFNKTYVSSYVIGWYWKVDLVWSSLKGKPLVGHWITPTGEGRGSAIATVAIDPDEDPPTMVATAPRIGGIPTTANNRLAITWH